MANQSDDRVGHQTLGLSASDAPLHTPDTIAAIATPPGSGGIGVVRLSGAGVAGIARALTGHSGERPAHWPPARQALLTGWRDAAGELIDRGLLLYFPAPHSFTGDDVLELQAHGGPVILHMLLARCLELGARLAEPGEFTRRAYLNGKMDLACAEAVADLIAARSEQAARCAQRCLNGAFSTLIHALVENLIDVRARLEATLDFPEEETDPAFAGLITERLSALRVALDDVLRRAQQGRLLAQGLRVVLAGRPNVGKSSLLNQLAGTERAIVTDVPGTTRDTIHAEIHIHGVALTLMDTAGLRMTSDPVEQMGIARTHTAIADADILLEIVDACNPSINPEDHPLPHAFQGCRIIVENKCDLAGRDPSMTRAADGYDHVVLSAKTGAGIDLLRQALLGVAGTNAAFGEDALLARSRHIEALRGAQENLNAAIAHNMSGDTPEMCAEALRQSQRALGLITGEFCSDDLLGEIFSRFCLGK
jgi:tRNA modification GTPase